MRRLPVLALSVLVGTALGCGDHGDKGPNDPPPTANGTTISGRVRLEGELWTHGSNSEGRRIVESADSVLVELYRGATLIGSERTRQGMFTFEELADGSYRLEARVTPFFRVEQEIEVPLASGAETIELTLAPFGGLANPPNPFDATGTGLEGLAATADTIFYRVYTPGGRLVYRYDQPDYPAGFFHIHWIGTNTANVVQPRGTYWACVLVDRTWRVNLLFFE